MLAQSGEQWLLLLPGEKPLQLASLTGKVQWDTKMKAAARVSESEAGAFKRLVEEAATRKERLRVTGPLRRGEKGELALEVRDFAWIKPQIKATKVARVRK